MRLRHLALAAAIALGACNRGYVAQLSPADSARMEYMSAFAAAADDASAGRYASADKGLLDFATRYPGTIQAVDAIYLRALYKLDPANQVATARDAGVLLDAYLAAGGGTHRSDAVVLRRVATAMDARPAAPREPAQTSSRGDGVTASDLRAKDEELSRVKDELAKANAELERIRRRLAPPKP